MDHDEVDALDSSAGPVGAEASRSGKTKRKEYERKMRILQASLCRCRSGSRRPARANRCQPRTSRCPSRRATTGTSSLTRRNPNPDAVLGGGLYLGDQPGERNRYDCAQYRKSNPESKGLAPHGITDVQEL